MVQAGADMVVVDASAKFKGSARFDDELDIAMGIERLGATSMVSALTVSRDGERLVEGRLVHVFVDPETMAKQEVPAFVREKLAPYATGSAT